LYWKKREKGASQTAKKQQFCEPLLKLYQRIALYITVDSL